MTRHPDFTRCLGVIVDATEWSCVVGLPVDRSETVFGGAGKQMNMSNSPDDDRLEELREQKRKELEQRQQQGQSPQDQEAQEAAQQQAEAQKEAMLKQHLTDGARQRLNAVQMSKPEFADKVEQQIIAEVAEDAVDRMVDDGFPRNGIQQVHDHALESVAALDVVAIADGTRRDDRVPNVSRASAQSIEDRRGVDYIAPLSGFGRHAVDRLVETTFEVEVGPSEEVQKADYEDELRTLLADRHGSEAVAEVFPDHEQTYVHGRR